MPKETFHTTKERIVPAILLDQTPEEALLITFPVVSIRERKDGVSETDEFDSIEAIAKRECSSSVFFYSDNRRYQNKEY